jgi:5-methylcytosine-specific restriction endonuclease McrA
MAGQPVEWLDWQTAVCLYARDVVGWSLGGVVRRVHGGVSRLTSRRSVIDIPAIIACEGSWSVHLNKTVTLSNTALFARDNYQCLYCGGTFPAAHLSRDHVHPRSRGGMDRWENVVAACKRCNSRKGNWLLEELSMELLALPYRPNNAEYLALINNKRIRGDQAEYLRPQFNHLQHI